MEDLKQQYLDELQRLSNLEYRNENKIAELKENFNGMSIEIRKKEKLLQEEQWAYLSTHPSKRLLSFNFDDDDEDYTSTITPDEPVLSTEEPDNSLSMGDEHLDTIPETESDEFIKSAFHDDNVKEISSGSPTTHSESPLYASFMFDLSINPFPPADRSDSYEFTDELIPFISAPEFKRGEGYHVVPPPYIRNYMPLRADLSFAGLDNYVYKSKVSETIISVPKIDTNASTTSKDSLEKPKTFRSSAPLIEEWESNSEDENVFEPKEVKKTVKPSLEKIEFVNDRNTTVENENKAENPRNLIKKWISTINAAKQSSHRAAASVSAARRVNTAASRPNMNNALPIIYSYFKAHSPVRRAFNQKSAAKTNNFNEKFNTAKVNNVTTVRLKAVVSAAEGNRNNAVNGCSRHITGNKSYLTGYQEIDGGFVAFGGNAKRGKITEKGKIRTGKLYFEDVYFVKELKLNLFSILQMYDKKNSALFTDTERVILFPDFKLLDESQVLLKVPRNNIMYSFDLNNVVPVGRLNFLFVKATLDKSNLWHRRLGYVNFKTMNKLVRGNLVRGLPSKIFKKDHTCVACQKGKQHKASCKTKTTYCLVVIDDFSRFSWVFFLATKDETHEILKNFITDIENQIDHKVKTIRCDNGTEFKNRIMNDFCEMKGIRREFIVAMTPQQNGRKCALSFMRLFGCPVTILNTLDHLGNQKNGNEGTKENIDAGQPGKKTVPGPQYVLIPLLTSNSQGLKNSKDEVADDAGKKSTEVPRKENRFQDPAKEDPGRERAQRNKFKSIFRQDNDANGNKMFTPVSDVGSTYVNLGRSIYCCWYTRLLLSSTKVNAASSRVTTADTVATAGWIKTEIA
nr:hypothetical protein [Tanacetum cinerariifolium]